MMNDQWAQEIVALSASEAVGFCWIVNKRMNIH